MRIMRRGIGLGVVMCIVLSIGLVPTVNNPSATQAQDSVPRFEPSACEFDLIAGQIDGETVECGYLVVPEDRSQPDGQTIRLAVAIYKSTSDNPGAPFVRLDGGPGGHSVGNYGPFLDQFNSTVPLLEMGDLIMIDQRGVGLSEPSLACTEETDLTIELFDELVSSDLETDMYQQAMQACRDRLVQSGVNLDAYNSLENAADIHDLWTTLGYEEINLYGVSYGTRLALEIMRDYPEGLRSVILDSTYPPQADLYVDIGSSAQRSLDVLFTDCANHDNCNATYPTLEADFYALIDHLNAAPVELDLVDLFNGDSYQFIMTGDAFFELVFSSLYATSVLIYLPIMIEDAFNGDFAITELLASAIFLDFSLDFGTYLSVQCFEEVHFQTASEVSVASDDLPAAINYFAVGDQPDIFALCNIWDVATSNDLEEMPVVSDIPTLVLSGRYDPITPPRYGQMAAETLSSSYFFEYPGMGHGVFDDHPCSLNISMQFLEDPTTEPDSGCIAADMHTPDFVTR